MKKLLIESVAQIVVWGLVAFVAGVTALIFGGAVGGSATGTAPEASLSMRQAATLRTRIQMASNTPVHPSA